MLLESKSKFSILSPTRDASIEHDKFYNWSTKNMYRTSYNDMAIKSPVDKKSYAIPKYQGFIPNKDATSQLGAGFTQITRRCFLKSKLDDKPNHLASTGFNWKLIPKHDPTLDAWTYKYGKATIQNPHPTIEDPMRTTTFRQSFNKPYEMPRPNTRQVASCKNLFFDQKVKESLRTSTAASGFGKNFLLCDGKTWVPEKVLHSDMVRTEYRGRFNQEKPFHKSKLMNSTGRLPKRTLTYDRE